MAISVCPDGKSNCHDHGDGSQEEATNPKFSTNVHEIGRQERKVQWNGCCSITKDVGIDDLPLSILILFAWYGFEVDHSRLWIDFLYNIGQSVQGR